MCSIRNSKIKSTRLTAYCCLACFSLGPFPVRMTFLLLLRPAATASSRTLSTRSVRSRGVSPIFKLVIFIFSFY